MVRSVPFARVALTPGSRLGHYEIQSLRGVGGMGEVYRSRDVRLDRTVAVKWVRSSQLAADAESRRRFEREARSVAALAHPHICALYDIGEAPHPDEPNGEPVQFLVIARSGRSILVSTHWMRKETGAYTRAAAGLSG